MIDQLTDAECEITECVARKVNEVIEAVEGLQGQADAHEAMLNALQRWIGRVEGLVTEEVGQAADPVEAPTVEDRLEAMQATWQIMSESYTDACAEAKRLRAERDALRARVAELEKEDTERLERGCEKARHMERECERLRNENARLHERAGLAVLDKGLSDVLFTWGGVVATARRQLATYPRPERQAPVNSCIVDLYDALVQARTERDAALARVAELEKEDTERLERGREKARHMEKEIATLKRAVREARGTLDYGHIWTPNDTQYVRDAIAALSAALDEEATDATH